MTVYCASGNPGKLREFRLAGEVLGIRIDPLPGLRSIRAPEEDGTTFDQNARVKASYYSQLAPGLVFADDSGLAVDALGGAPGVHSARYAGTDAGDGDNNRLLLEKLRGRDNRAARFICVIALARDGAVLATFRGEVEGAILTEARGPGGFGYDPLFFYPPFGGTFGEVADERKFAVSHRGNALRLMLRYLTENPGLERQAAASVGISAPVGPGVAER